MHYYEIRIQGKWSPRTAAEKPKFEATKSGVIREKTISGLRFPIRDIVEVPEGMEELSLEALMDAKAEMLARAEKKGAAPAAPSSEQVENVESLPT